ncbi:MAG: aspartyl/asparaginyl beta-hydroxylase domain-containing protein [Myxococcales bacterium]|nr:aspartyl/asparaginyl beta-hydroxylase domain-containing protein [Myxococcales bacterium]
MAETAAGTAEEPVWYYIDGSWYKGTLPWFPDVRDAPATRILKENWKTIREEVEAAWEERPDRFQENFTPYAWREAGWRTVNLHSYFLRSRENCKRFPRTAEIVERIPNMSLAQIAVLQPNTTLKAHFGDTNAVTRLHLGLIVPGGLPELGLRVARETRTWHEGEVFAITIAHRHKAWNHTDQHRVVLVVDVIRDEYVDQRYEIAAKALTAIAMKYCATKVPALKKLPRPLVRSIHTLLWPLFRLRLLVGRFIDR